MRCYICNYCDEVESKDLLDSLQRRRVTRQYDNKDVCTSCIKSSKEMHNTYLWSTKVGGKNSGIEDLIDELRERIPGLFVGPECPLEFTRGAKHTCSCTFKTGCMMLINKDNKNS